MTLSRPTPQAAGALRDKFREVRAASLALAAPLSAEDQCIQSMPDASPTKWHLAHTTWFFETVLLEPHATGYRPFDVRFHYLFNSYYEALGPRHPRPQRGLLTRPSVDEVHAYRRHVDEAVVALLEQGGIDWAVVEPIVTLGLNHEQQHQELLLTDILHALSCNPMLPAYKPASGPALRLASVPPAMRWIAQEGGVVEVGHASEGFSFDNETPRHRALVQPHAIADRLVNCGDYAQFIADGGYQRPELWLSDGWAAVQANGWRHPAYWLASDDPRLGFGGASGAAQNASGWHVFGLHGVRPVEADAPVSQLSFYEAAAYAEWAGARLPTEFEWEAAYDAPGISQMAGHVWQWTRSSYDPYPGFRPMPGIAAEYNGKFMVGQLVLRGGSVATPAGHTRPSYRNFFPPAARWQFSGLRLAKDL
ncbi:MULTISPECIES: ergothioneine biosynthesis protein EgtB [unclassified Variovorax]|uniref:ergothioneine biosynthesis protein EgtB n=1 Tax=unclassified Variovorax TaxID=663243 RepID=UPI0008C22FD5|nr:MULTISPECIES: ergothioneine biosynthesis protein EgtB [unclassified Variovorax]SEJ52793.1 ergothioneine biosynthesis protein EgtB [Variovorax sp. OK202]SFC55834.1 ergothioneine biosynthesis protein EgtB [Variovorax sp. OK212]